MKLTTWNAEWLDSHWGVVSGLYAPGQDLFPEDAPSLAEAQARIAAVGRFIGMLAPDILFLCEAPRGADQMAGFAAAAAPGYDLVMRPAGTDYEIDGRQWMWFLVRKDIADLIQPELVPVETWRAFCAEASDSIRADGTWKVSAPRLTDFGDIRDVPVAERRTHRFYREPQVLRYQWGGARHEVIGAHLKSKHTGISIPKRQPGEDLDAYIAASKTVQRFMAEAHEARVKLSSEALVIRAYIDRRFQQEADPSIVVLGDLNDGPGKEVMEREYLLHDLISNLQGEVFFARKFLNHALFDQPDHLRWTAQFRDDLDPERPEHILLDHILFTQALTSGGTSPLVARARSGWVEHLAFEEAEALLGRGMLSDHRPVSLRLVPRIG
ncbi:MAG: endonuclease/exonuclease/phosphatase [Rhodobacteraceae bacterium]|nr:endonuclease/exonuclease/phosphatase [Paracoccaceae bacterium]MBR9822608.1 endonuclease/exonuclease/phosphatase [Paracoccaceae bacterium]